MKTHNSRKATEVHFTVAFFGVWKDPTNERHEVGFVAIDGKSNDQNTLHLSDTQRTSRGIFQNSRENSFFPKYPTTNSTNTKGPTLPNF